MIHQQADFRLDFIGIGAAKSGTTWLADNLRQHPQIFIPELKELVYFNQHLSRMPGVENSNYSLPLSWYHDFFSETKQGLVNGEISVEYLINGNAAKDIYRYNPKVKILVVLRYPPKQLHSLYLYLVQRGVINFPTFEQAIEKRPDLFMHYNYYQHLLPYFETFPKEQIKVLLFDELKKDNKAFLKETLDFLGVKEFYPPSIDDRSNETKEPRMKWLNHLIQNTRQNITKYRLEWVLPVLRYSGILPLGMLIRDKLNVRKMAKKPQLSPETEQYLKAHYQADIQQLEQLLERDLSAWK